MNFASARLDHADGHHGVQHLTLGAEYNLVTRNTLSLTRDEVDIREEGVGEGLSHVCFKSV